MLRNTVWEQNSWSIYENIGGQPVLDAGIFSVPEKFELFFSDGSSIEVIEKEYGPVKMGESYCIEKIRVNGIKAFVLRIYRATLQNRDNRAHPQLHLWRVHRLCWDSPWILKEITHSFTPY